MYKINHWKGFDRNLSNSKLDRNFRPQSRKNKYGSRGVAQMHYLNQHRGMMNKKKPFRALFVKYFHKRRKRDLHKMIQLVSASGM